MPSLASAYPVLHSALVATASYEAIKEQESSSTVLNFFGERFTLHLAYLPTEQQMLAVYFEISNAITFNNGYVSVGTDVAAILSAIVPGLTPDGADMIANLVLSGERETALEILGKFEKEGGR